MSLVKLTLRTGAASIFFALIYAAFYTAFVPPVTRAQTVGSIYDPYQYTIAFFTFIPAWGLKLTNGLADVTHLSTLTVTYGYETNIDFKTPPEVLRGKAFLYYLDQDGRRIHEYTFYDVTYPYVPAAYTWTKPGVYEVDIEGITADVPSYTYLTTLSFTVVMRGGPAPTCTLSAIPNTLYPKQGNSSAALQWTSTDATSAVMDQGVGSIQTTGSLSVLPTATTTYTATFVGANGTTTCATTVNVPDPVVLPLHEKAAALAKQLVNRPDAYLWGGKGWDYDLAEFTSPQRILSGYTYFDPNTSAKKTGIGVDCSGLITWAFNRANNLYAGFNSNYIKYVNADGMFRDPQSDPVAESDLRPGDTLSFDWDGNGRMDHVAMYVGDSGGYDIVDASSPDIGIRDRIKDTFKLTPGFVDYRRIHQADAKMSFTTGSPVNLKVADPNGHVLDASTISSSSEEFIREIPGEMYYLELEQGHDGRPKDQIILPTLKDGAYTIEVVPEAGALPTDTYSLTVELNGVETVVVDNETIASIPTNGFTVKLSGGVIQGLDPTIKVLLQDLYQSINNLTLSSKSTKRGLLASVESALAWFEKNRTDQIIRKLNKLQNDLPRKAGSEITAAELQNINTQINELLTLLNN